MRQQITDTVLMVRPANFGFNPVTAASNAFQDSKTELSAAEIQALALQEFDEFVAKLRAANIEVIAVADTVKPVKYDAIFPNNWFSTHSDGTIVLYPMYAPMRRLERRTDILALLSKDYILKQQQNLETHELEARFLEGTGSLILDRPNKLVYACRSIRTNEQVLDEFCAKMDYQKVLFDASDADGQAIYHTNVMMAVAEQFVVICMDSVKNKEEHQALKVHFARTNKAILELSLEQMASFAGNMLQVKNKEGATFLVMSEQAYKSLSNAQIAAIETHTNILHSPIYTIEQFGGGSARCMLAEIFLSRE